ncbi:MAG: hypothetical protein B1H04_00150 [Planctomycetales bacterium 4484_123]|nr:MAG: hypothetical protein B1H04_00150 [Planctomycetales bacterium 4484_123]
MPEISKKAAVAKPSALAEDVRVGPFSVIGPEVTIGPGCVVHNNVTILGATRIGANCELFPGCVVGIAPDGGMSETGRCVVDSGNVLREHVIIEAGLAGGAGTHVGPNNLIMVGCQVRHDAHLEGEGIFANFTCVEAHAHIEKYVRTYGFTAVKSYATVGAYALTTGYASVECDVPPYAIVQGLPTQVRSVNSEGLRRCGFDARTIEAIKAAFRMLFDGRGALPTPEALEATERRFDDEHVRYLIECLRRSAAAPSGRRRQPVDVQD